MEDEELLNKIDLMFQEYIKPIMDFISVQKALKDFGISDKSTAPKATNSYTKQSLGGYTIAKKGCNKCGGKITWDNYEQINEAGFPQNYPDHLDEDGNIIDCPEYNK